MTASYRSRPDLKPPLITVKGSRADAAAGYMFVTPTGPLIVDNTGNPLWINQISDHSANLQVQQYRGGPVLTWWQGDIVDGVGANGKYFVLDESYRTIMTVQAHEALSADLHEFVITGDGVAYFTAYRPFTTDLRAVGGPRQGAALDATVQGVDLATGALVFDWRSSDHIELSESYLAYSDKVPFDAVHLNSIEATADGKLLVSARHTWALYKIDPTTGKVLWRLGGKKSDFSLGSGVRFAWQHHAREHPGSLISLFDNESYPKEAKQSRGLLLHVDESAMTAEVLRQYPHPGKPILSGSEGSVQILPNGNVLVGWGVEPYYTELQSDGTLVLDASLEEGQSYRAFRFPWAGRPTDRPSVATEKRSNGRLAVYVSWNGSTETASWQVLAGPAPGILAPVHASPRMGFETIIEVRGVPDYLAVRALDANGVVLATSSTVRV